MPADKLPEAYAKVIGEADSGAVAPVFSSRAPAHESSSSSSRSPAAGRRATSATRTSSDRIREQLGQQLAIRRYIDRLRQSTYVDMRS